MASSFSFLRTPSDFHGDVSVSNTHNPTINDRQIDKPTALSVYLSKRRIVSDCPHIISDAGFEWFYRFCREPKRLAARYLLGNPAFALHIALAMFHKMSLRVELPPKLN
ncbi:WecB/TagA/CpsF family glycosyltransferase [Rivularia sp. PCC 7116]|uniref:WecB/TagA/CpsF family glycosyltransferase n=1 Tax=Rivularia sp. PCC 7116 TaxID=373994 RepID=UPI0002ECA96C|nr:WecB/TagA/CpsF family glycosyltransferase [Rivularia sp. PCC 7116]